MVFSSVRAGLLGSPVGVGKRVRFRLLVPVVVLVGLAGAGSALGATDTLDQFSTGNEEVGLVTGPSYTTDGAPSASTWAQTFTAGLSGPLDRVSLNLDYGMFSPYGGNGGPVPSNDLTVEITGVDAFGAPDLGNVLATTTISESNTFGQNGGNGVWYDAVFQPAPMIAAGTEYAIVPLAQGSDEYDWLGSQGSDYAGGESCSPYGFPPTPSSLWGCPTVYDETFETWVGQNFTSTISGSHKGAITVAPGQSVLVSAGAVISGSVTVNDGGVLVIQSGAKIKGSLTATGAGSITACGATIGAPVTITGDSGQVIFGDGGTCAGDSISGNVKITGGTGSGVSFVNNTVAGSLTITHNQGTINAASNTVSKNTTTSPNP